jgi:hypothetical protein
MECWTRRRAEQAERRTTTPSTKRRRRRKRRRRTEKSWLRKCWLVRRLAQEKQRYAGQWTWRGRVEDDDVIPGSIDRSVHHRNDRGRMGCQHRSDERGQDLTDPSRLVPGCRSIQSSRWCWEEMKCWTRRWTKQVERRALARLALYEVSRGRCVLWGGPDSWRPHARHVGGINVTVVMCCILETEHEQMRCYQCW